MAVLIGETYQAHGKLLLSGEYFVLDGALALALPTRMGQRFEVASGTQAGLNWQGFDADGMPWIQAAFELPGLNITTASNQEIAQRLQQILQQAFQRSTLSLETLHGCVITSRLDFSRHWGLGTSSTLISFLAALADVDPYQLLEDTFGGSGYDLACARATGPILYQNRTASSVSFNPPFSSQLYFIYLGKKQNSREGIQRYRTLGEISMETIEQASQLALDFVNCVTLSDFESCIQRHENLVASTLGLPRAQELWFADYWGQIKSLGAWGGDFVLVSSNRGDEETNDYFKSRGFEVVIQFKDMVL